VAKVKHLVEYQSELEKDSAELRNHLHALIDFFVASLAPSESNRRRVALHEVLTVDELAGRLKVPRSTIEEMARAGKLPGAFRIGKHWRFDLDVLRANLSTIDPERRD
jgi:excisionase family DNA binding protein